ncbi:MAG TPA: ribose 5-phosphate isomerase B [Clostridia bacterium]|nr:ribose 5-phosphate isomerase B [Clostridia bacterium]
MIAIAADHGGFKLKGIIIKYLQSMNIKYKDYGSFTEDAVDYPDVALIASESIINGECDKGILICGTGIGISIAANKVTGIRAALCGDTFSARMSRLHNDANILTMGARVIGEGLAIDIVNIWLNTEFEGGKHTRRVDKLKDIECKYSI